VVPKGGAPAHKEGGHGVRHLRGKDEQAAVDVEQVPAGNWGLEHGTGLVDWGNATSSTYQFVASSPPLPVPIIMPPNTRQAATSERQRTSSDAASRWYMPLHENIAADGPI